MRKAGAALACLLLLAPLATHAQVKQVRSTPGSSEVTYKLVHPLHEVLATSKSAFFVFDLDESTKQIKHVSASVDVTSFDSGNSNRDSHAMEVIDALSYPEASFTSSSVTQTGDSVIVAGSLTFHGVTKSILVNGTAHWSQEKLEVTGSFAISLTEFKVERPSLLLIPVEDKLTFTLLTAAAL